LQFRKHKKTAATFKNTLSLSIYDEPTAGYAASGATVFSITKRASCQTFRKPLGKGDLEVAVKY
jgi:hypothetical protein